MLQLNRIRRYAKIYRKEVDSLWSAYKIGWLLGKAPDELNDRTLEWPWVLKAAKEMENKGLVLDVGSSNTPLPLDLENLGFDVKALDINASKTIIGKNINVIASDIRNIPLPDNSLDLITCVSVLEHIGVKGRYGTKENDSDGDMKAMCEMSRLLKPGGCLLITIPYGSRDVLPVNKCYNRERTNRLFKGLKKTNVEFFIYAKGQGWTKSTEADAEKVNWYLSPWYSIGCFKLVKQ